MSVTTAWLMAAPAGRFGRFALDTVELTCLVKRLSFDSTCSASRHPAVRGSKYFLGALAEIHETVSHSDYGIS